MQIKIHQTHHTIANFTEIFSYLKTKMEQGAFDNSINIFPELFLTGYPLQDLLLTREFIEKYHAFFEDLKQWWINNSKKDQVLLVGGLKYHFEGKLPHTIENVIIEFSEDKNGKDIYTKCLLPSYDIFDETKYFTPGNKSFIWQYKEYHFALMICEDMWHSPHYHLNPVDKIHQLCNEQPINGIINLSASPYHIGKIDSRIARAKEISQKLNAPFYYVNRVGGEDEIIFDGTSFIVDGDTVCDRALGFKEDIISGEIKESRTCPKFQGPETTPFSFHSLYKTRIEKGDRPSLKPLRDGECEHILHTLNLGIQDYAKKAHAKNFLVALSGGVDSALVLTLLRLFKKEDQQIEAVYMPSRFSHNLSYEISRQLCENLDVKMTTQSIKFLHSAISNSFSENFEPLSGLADENVQSRIRGALIYTRSNQTGALVLNTSNKSELSVGYSTLYGDSVGAISPLGDLYKSEVYQLCKYINKKYNKLIPTEVIERAPSAELREDQKDEDSLPPYEVLDVILEGYLSYRFSASEITQLGINEEDVQRVIKLNKISEYKRKQFCPVIKLKPKSYGFGRRIPISKNINYDN